MRLLNTKTLGLENFSGDAPPYAILSHRWGLDEEEPTFDDMTAKTADQKAGYQKILRSAGIAAKASISYIWIDTICINKSSTTELSEAINSMFRYYERSQVCYAYLEDIASNEEAVKNITASEWWQRGWTLQELIAPEEVIFYSTDWRPIGAKTALARRIAQATRINEAVLKKTKPLSHFSVAKRMSWAAERKTKREEDIAYCLIGIFNVNMPMLYGEGLKAFTRLQEEIMKESSDQSLFAWSYPPEFANLPNYGGVLSPHPARFLHSADIDSFEGSEQFDTGTEPYAMTNQGLRIRLPVVQEYGSDPIAVLACHSDGNFDGPLGIHLQPVPGSRNEIFVRDISIPPRVVNPHRMRQASVRSIYILKTATMDDSRARYAWIRTVPRSMTLVFEIEELYAGKSGHWHSWDRSNRTTTSPADTAIPFEEHKGAIVLQDSLTALPRCGIIFTVDSKDKYSISIAIHLAPQGPIHSASLVADMNTASNFGATERIASAKISPQQTVTAMATWNKIMNKEVLIIDIVVHTTVPVLRKVTSVVPFAFSPVAIVISFFSMQDTAGYSMSTFSVMVFLQITSTFIFLSIGSRNPNLLRWRWQEDRLGVWGIPSMFLSTSVLVCFCSILAGFMDPTLALSIFCYGAWVLYVQLRGIYIRSDRHGPLPRLAASQNVSPYPAFFLRFH